VKTLLRERLRGSPMFSMLLRGSSVAFALQIFGAGAKYLLQIFAARWMGPDEFGSFTYIYNWALIFTILSGLGISSAALRFVPEYKANQAWNLLRGFVQRSTHITILSGILAALAYAVFLWLSGEETRWEILAAGMLIVILTGLTTHQSQLMRGLKDILFAFTPTRVLQPTLGILFLFAAWRVFGALSSLPALTSMAASLALVAVAQVFGLQKILPSLARSAPPRFETEKWLRVSLPMLTTAVSYAFISQIDIALVGIWLPPAQVGLYAAASKTAMLVSVLLVSVNAIVAPMIAELFAQQEMEKLSRLTRTATQWMTLPVLGATVILALTGRSVLGWFGSRFSDAYPALMILTLGQLVNALTGPVGYLTELTGHQQVSARIYLLAAALAVTLNIWLIPRLGILGAAIGTATAFSASNLALYVFVYVKVLKK